ncbi:hypothetical protein CANCADRAFT_125580 [Tortispora caseinolytica NRRL Y-17796]|uniref:Anaphase-promoting complex subunit 4-like WD40 domain-containing protein n=1 Tax=Tortispora caseinolytica NRRL Y-17796 TaxID=767744 RepID=A0A1E4T9Y3_9ASCO|nr:hypothetical protein CANCADRAFT_125580 [Tortispora caseinolytica NRRL Y-17796]
MAELKDNWAALPTTERSRPVHLSFDAKSRRIAYAANKSVFLRNVDTPERCLQYNGHIASTSVAKFAPSGFYVASGDVSGKVRVWDCVGEDLILKGEYSAISGRINDIAWDADSARIIAVGDGKERYGHCFTADSGNSVGEIAGHSAVVNAVAIRPVRPYKAATVSDDHSLVFYNGPPFKFKSAVRGHHTNFCNDVAYSPDGTTLISVGSDRRINSYDPTTGDFKETLNSDSHTGSIFAISWNPNSTKFATSSADGTVKLWNANGELDQTFVVTSGDHQVGVVHTGEDTLISLSLDGTLYYFTYGTESPTRTISGHQKAITAATLSAGRLITGSYDGRVVSWTLDGSPTLVAGDGPSNLVAFLQSASDCVLAASWDDTLRSISDGSFSGSASIDAQPKGLGILPDNHAVVLTETEITVYKCSPISRITSLPVSAAVSLSISEDLIAVGSGSSLSLYRFAGGELKPESSAFPATTSPISVVSLSPDGSLLAAGTVNGKIILYNAKEYTIITSRWAFHTGRITSISWNAASTHVVTSSLDTHVFVYSVAKPGKNLKISNAHKEGALFAQFKSDSEVFSVGADACVKSWSVTLP